MSIPGVVSLGMVARKRLLRRQEAEAAALNIRSLQGGVSRSDAVTATVDTGDFLRIVRDLRRVHSHIAALAYPVLERAAEYNNRDTEASAARRLPATAIEADWRYDLAATRIALKSLTLVRVGPVITKSPSCANTG